MTDDREVEEAVTLPAQPASVSAARRFVRRFGAEAVEDDVLVDDAALVVSELVANAVLHAGGPVVVTLRFRSGETDEPAAVRVSVADGSPVPPVIREYGTGASTGRGLALVARLVDAWGVELVEQGKVVWADLRSGRAADAVTPPATTVDSTPPGATPEAVAGIVFLQVPVRLYQRLQEQNDAVLRELELLAFTADHAGDLDPSPALVDVIERSRRYFNLTREGMRQEVMAAAQRGEETADLHGSVTVASIAPAAELVALFEDAERLSEQGELLVAPPEPEVGRLRRWFVSEMSRQLLEREPPQPFAT